MMVVTGYGSIVVTALLASSRKDAHPAAAQNAKTRPTGLTSLVGPASRVTPTPARTIHKKSTARRDPTTATVSGPRNSTATTTPSGALDIAM
jgi:hypothetical protein